MTKLDELVEKITGPICGLSQHDFTKYRKILNQQEQIKALIQDYTHTEILKDREACLSKSQHRSVQQS